MLIQMKPAQDSSPKPPVASGMMAPPVLCEPPAPLPVRPRVRRPFWLAAGGAVAVASMAEVYLYVHRPNPPEPAWITAGHFSRPVRRNWYSLSAKSDMANGHASTPQVVAWSNVQVTAIFGDAQGHFVARVNHQLVTVGDNIDGMTVVGISAQRVKFTQGSAERDFPVGGGGE